MPAKLHSWWQKRVIWTAPATPPLESRLYFCSSSVLSKTALHLIYCSILDVYWNILRYTILEDCQSRLKREVWNRNVFLHLKMGNRFDLRTILIESAEICMFWPSQPVPSCLISHLVHSFPLSKPLMPLPWAAVTLLLFHAPLPIFLFPTWVGKMCVLVGPINLHFHGACSHSPSIPGLNPKTFICSNFLSSVLTYIDGAVLEVMIDLFQRITWTQQDLCRQITFKKKY